VYLVTPLRLLAVGFIYCCAAVAWSTLGASLVARTGESDTRLAKEVAMLWGGEHAQKAPSAFYETTRTVVEDVQASENASIRRVSRAITDRNPVFLDASDLRVELKLDQRRKGLLWYSTYGVAFSGHYRLHNPQDAPEDLFVHFDFPSTEAIYDGFSFRVNGDEAPSVSDLSQGTSARIRVPAKGEVVVDVVYRSRGLGEWTYAFGGPGVSQVRNLHFDMTTDFTDIDFPAGTLSPTAKSREGKGWKLEWAFSSLVTGQKIGMVPPRRLNPGPLAARVTFFAPVSLLFFVTVLVILGVVRGQSLHPMNYFFLSAAFFAFHLLLAYLVDHLEINASFLIASATSIFLVLSYLRLVWGPSRALLEAGFAQLVFLVLFSYAFLFEGYTGLTVTVGAVITLFVLMQITGKVDWSQIQRSELAPDQGKP
jgi:hypothetical protein